MALTKITSNVIANNAVTQAKIDSSVSLGGGIESVASRPGSPTAGTVILNTTSNVLEVWTGTDWITLASQSLIVQYLVIGGGGGGGGYGSYWNRVG